MKSPAALRAHIESSLSSQFAAPLTFQSRSSAELVSSGVEQLDALTGGLPRGAITDIYGPACSGRTSLLLAMLAEATARQEFCALIDSTDALDPHSSEAAGVHLSRLLWVRCGSRPESALKAADLIVQAGGFGLIALDLADLAPRAVRSIPLASWFRFRRAVEDTPSALVVVEQEPSVKSCASLILEVRAGGPRWSGAPGCSLLLRGGRSEVLPRKPVVSTSARLETRALG